MSTLPGRDPGRPTLDISAPAHVAATLRKRSNLPRQMTRQLSPATKPTKQKRRKSTEAKPAAREPSPDEVLYEVRDIIDEKRVKGQLLYKVDWADNPTTGESFSPTWEPAENVTEAAVADWEEAKKRRRGLHLGSSHPSAETDSQPVLPPDWRAKRRRDLSDSVSDEEGVPKRLRGSIDSGYTSTDGDSGPSWELVQSVPDKGGELVCELSAAPGFDPSDYRIISSSQSAPSSQLIVLDIAASQGEGNQPSSGLISQRTVPDSQDGFDSLRTQSTALSAPVLDASSIQPLSQPAQEGSTQELDKEQQASIGEGQTSRSDLNIPSHQPGTSHHESWRSSGLRETQELEQASSRASLSHPTNAGQEQKGFSPGDSPFAEGFLTQPDFELPLPTSLGQTEPSRTGEALSSTRPSDRDRRQEREPNQQSNLLSGSYFFLSGSESHPQFQAAQEVSPPGSRPEQLFTQPPEARGNSQDIIPETVQKAAKRRSTPQSARKNATRPTNGYGEEPGRSPNLPGSLALPGALQPSTPEPARDTSLPLNPRNRKMDRPPEEAPTSAVDVFRQIHAQVFGTSSGFTGSGETGSEPVLVPPSADLPGIDHFTQHLGGAVPEPTHEAAPLLETTSREHPLSVVEELSRRINMDLNRHPENAAVGGGSLEYEQPATTVTPADLTTSVHRDLAVGDHQYLGESAKPPVPTPEHAGRDQYPLDVSTNEPEGDSHSRHFTVTLPMAANTRATYVDTVLENKATMIEFGEVFANSYSSVPDASLVAKMDAIFERLLNLCDLPSYNDSIPDLDKEAMMKHATNSNSKFLFVYEFLNSLRDINARILILTQPGRVFEFLEALVAAAECPYTVLGQEASTGLPTNTAAMSVILAMAGQDLTKIQGGVDVVIAFDHTAKSVELPATMGYESMGPIVLSLVVTHSLEHIDLQLAQVEQGLNDLERKNALNLATGAANNYLRSPSPDPNYLKPHKAAKIFAELLRSPGHVPDWEPDPLPPNIFEFWLSSQERTQASQGRVPEVDIPNGPDPRKRFLENVEEGIPKRPRLLLESRQPSRNATPALMSDLLKQTLADNVVDSMAITQLIEVPIEQLERMSAKIADLEARLAAQSAGEAQLREHVASLESQLRSHQRTVQSIEPKYMDALRDRRDFEKECKAAVVKANAATERLEAQKSELEALKEKNKFLESKLAEANSALANSTVPDIAKLAQAEKDRNEGVATVEKLEKRVRTIQNEVEYSRKAYQDASNAHSELNQENRDLKAKVADLERRAGENLLKIHQIHAENEMAEANRQIDELQAILENRERELERAKDELKALKNGRRETRQASVPRSPRTGVISPRPGRGMGGAGSRGTSPAPFMSSDGPGSVGAGGAPLPGMAFFPPVGNGGRWGHLRD